MDLFLHQLHPSPNLFPKDKSLRFQVLIPGSGYMALQNIMRDIHPALSPATVATMIPTMQAGDSLEEHILNQQERETLCGC